MPNEGPESCRVNIWEWKYDPYALWVGQVPPPLPSNLPSTPTQVDTLVKLNMSAHVENRILLVHPIVSSEY